MGTPYFCSESEKHEHIGASECSTAKTNWIQMNRIEHIEDQLLDLRKQLTHHELYALLSEMEDVKLFMEKHVYAVWDFMSLVKALQQKLTCVSLPWKPAKNARTARFINEIVLGEESDVNEQEVPQSHYEMYLEAMHEVGADTQKVERLVDSFDALETILTTISESDLGAAEKAFLNFTFEVINTQETHKIAAAFTFGREDLIPDMFIEIIEKSNDGSVNQFPKLTYYLKRHIELDGDEHGPLALEMISELCGEDAQKWDDVLAISKKALEKRIELWDAIAKDIVSKSAALEA